jgi:ABC-type transport system involved in cytochrome bd biosynthesis fused ATPase/permease subunit
MPRKRIKELRNALAVRSIASIMVIFCWLIFVIIYLAFFSHDFSLMQTIAIILASLLFAIMLLSVMWAWWGISFGSQLFQQSARSNKKGKS